MRWLDDHKPLPVGLGPLFWRPNTGPWHHRTTLKMRGSGPATFLAIVLTLFFSLSTGCFAFPVGSVGMVGGENPGGCHGHHGPMPQPSPVHRCCFAAHQVPAATSITPSPTSYDAVADYVTSSPSTGKPSAIVTLPFQVLDASPPLTTVLRI